MHDFAKKNEKATCNLSFHLPFSFYTEDEDENVLFTTVADVVSNLFVSAVYDRRPRLAVQSVSILLPAFSGIPFPVHFRFFLQCPAQLYSLDMCDSSRHHSTVVLVLAIRFLYFEKNRLLCKGDDNQYLPYAH